jgi:hypothetical protein
VGDSEDSGTRYTELGFPIIFHSSDH